ncbi:ABC transporter substrate-binding protein [Marinobacter sp.]|uniref:ABC transporter substrate-binding protein n=1 Tax=Marinobacter sp. TaxID=50741 RepID=UPI0035630BC4
MNLKLHSEGSGKTGDMCKAVPPWLMAFILLFAWSINSYAFPDGNAPRVAFVASSGNPALDKHVTDLIAGHIRSDLALTPLSDNQLPYLNDEPVITIGPDAFTRVHQSNPNARIIATLVEDDFISDYARTSEGRITAVFYNVPLVRQALTGKAILPQATKVAIMASPENADIYDSLIDVLPSYGLQGQVFIVDNKTQLISTLVRALNYGDFLLGGPDHKIYNPTNIKHILLTAYRRNKILIGPSQAYVKAGALASSYPPFSSMAKKAAEFLESYLDIGIFPAPDHPDVFSVEVNEQVGRSLNIPLPDRQYLSKTVEELLRQPAQESVK